MATNGHVNHSTTQAYLESIISRLKTLRQVVESSRKTLKVQAAATTVQMLLGRANALRDLIIYGGADSVTGETIQKGIFGPPVEYWEKVFAGSESVE